MKEDYCQHYYHHYLHQTILILHYLCNLTVDKNGKVVFILLEINNLVVHVGHLEVQKHLKIDYVLQVKEKLMLLYQLNMLYLVIKMIMDVMEVN